MFKDDYRRELDKLTVSEKFRQDTISLMEERQEQLNRENKTAKTIKFTPKPYRKIAASAAVALLVVGTMIFAATTGGLMTGADNATETEAIDYVMEHETENGQQADDITADTFPALAHQKNSRVYTIDDAKPIEQPARDIKSDVSFSTQQYGGMGYEAVMYYNINEMATCNPFDTADRIDTLAVYQYSEIDYDQAYAEVMSVLKKLGKTTENITDVECSWSHVPDVYIGNATTYEFSSPHPDAVFSYMKVKFDGGEIEVYQSGTISVDIYNDVPDYVTNDEYVEYITDNYSSFIGDNITVYCYNDYSYNGQQLCTNHFYSASDEYSDNLLNYSIFDIVFSHIEDYVHYTDEKEEGIAFTYMHSDTYSKYANLPAIDYCQALWMLYNGKYHTTVPSVITTNSIVSKIEIVYKEPPRNYQTMVKEGWTVPFYKIYVELPEEFNTETDNGVLKHYGAYYVCAIHPDYIELTDDYIQFNGAY